MIEGRKANGTLAVGRATEKGENGMQALQKKTLRLGITAGLTLGAIVGLIAILIGAFFLTLDFKQIEDGIAYGAPREEAWLAAFGLTMTLVWIYIEMLRLVAIFSGDD